MLRMTHDGDTLSGGGGGGKEFTSTSGERMT
jgi:hypothetical protein